MRGMNAGTLGPLRREDRGGASSTQAEGGRKSRSTDPTRSVEKVGLALHLEVPERSAIEIPDKRPASGELAAAYDPGAVRVGFLVAPSDGELATA